MPTVGVGAEVLERWSAAFELPPSGHDHYTDDDDSKHEERINALAASGITHGCGPLVF